MRMIDGGRSIDSYPATLEDIMGRRDHPYPIGFSVAGEIMEGQGERTKPNQERIRI
jgi:hypothetical protein